MATLLTKTKPQVTEKTRGKGTSTLRENVLGFSFNGANTGNKLHTEHPKCELHAT